jgi:DNA-binding MarR family transcriptional regulator
MANKFLKQSTYAQNNYRLIHDIYVLLDADDRRVLQQFDLTSSQYRVLTLLAAEPEWRLIDLSDAMLCVRSTVTRIVDNLESSGLVLRVDHPADRRAQRLTLTPEGRQLLDRAQVAHGQALEQSLGLADIASQEHLMGLLQSLRAHLSVHLDQMDVT